MKKIKSLILVTLMLTSILGFSQTEKSLLWELSGNGLKSPSYLFGTIHILCPEDLEISPKINVALDKSEQLVLELDMDDPNFMLQMQQLTVNPDMRNISKSVSEEDLNSLNTFFKKHYQVDMSQLGIMKPFVLMSMMVPKLLDCPEVGSYEFALMEHAQKKEWETLGLEEVEEQFAIFDNISEKKQTEWLLSYINDGNKMKNIFLKLLSAYKEENINGLYELIKEQPEFKEMEDALLYNRNEKWIDKITKIASEKPTFFAVGAAHLASDKGVLTLLKKKGYTVKPIMD